MSATKTAAIPGQSCPICGSDREIQEQSCAECQSNFSLLREYEHLADNYYSAAILLARESKHEEALENLRLALAANPRMAEAWLVLGKLQAGRKNYEEALAAWRKVLELAPAQSPLREKAERCIAKAAELKQRGQDEAESKDRSRRVKSRMILAGLIMAALLVGIGATFWLLRMPTSVETARSAVATALDADPELKALNLRVVVRGASLALEGKAPTEQARRLAWAVSDKAAAGRPVDAGQIQVTNETMSSGLQRLLPAMSSTLSSHVHGPGEDLVRALSQANLAVKPSTDGAIHLAGSVPLPEIAVLVENLAHALAGPVKVDASELNVQDEYILYRVKSGDAPELIAVRMCGSRRYLQELRAFSPENRAALAALMPGMAIKIPKRLLKTATGG